MLVLAASARKAIVNSYSQDSRHKAHLILDLALYTINTTALLACAFKETNRNVSDFHKKDVFIFSAMIIPITVGPDFCKGLSVANGKLLSILRVYITVCGMALTYGLTQVYFLEEN